MALELSFRELWCFELGHFWQLFLHCRVLSWCNQLLLQFLCPRHEMAEGHIEFTLSLCVCVCVCVFQNRVGAIT